MIIFKLLTVIDYNIYFMSFQFWAVLSLQIPLLLERPSKQTWILHVYEGIYFGYRIPSLYWGHVENRVGFPWGLIVITVVAFFSLFCVNYPSNFVIVWPFDFMVFNCVEANKSRHTFVIVRDCETSFTVVLWTFSRRETETVPFEAFLSSMQ